MQNTMVGGGGEWLLGKKMKSEYVGRKNEEKEGEKGKRKKEKRRKGEKEKRRKEKGGRMIHFNNV